MKILSNKKYEEMQNLIEGYKKEHKKQDKIYELEIEKSRLENKIDILENNSTAMLSEIQKLIEWIEKIINDVGCFEVPENNSIRIPIYKNIYEKAYSNEFKEPRVRKEIHLPSITFMQMR